ncbi:DUF3800 domain-containing protein [Agarivorans litoreus]|uniref:DUF3800 domain-containing protein n=1 Tax=Agarivorans litoreus TaxID=1510455 RepID=UPI001C7CFFEC|nr:DUF3800 domain-containing protein [Agarivorans litoreus]
MSRNSQQKRALKKAKKEKIANKSAEAKRVKMNIVPTIYFDESGNTGSNLNDPNQPVFTLASCCFNEREAKKLCDLVGCQSEHEMHFKRLKRRKPGQDGIIRLMKHSLINTDTVKVNLFHKEFMIITKVVDILIEHMLHLKGHDLYVNGQNIALSNMLYYCLNSFCDEQDVKDMSIKFVQMVKEQTPASIESFYSSVTKLKDSCSYERFEESIDLILDTSECVNSALDSLDKSALDPSIPALFAQCVQWQQSYPKGYHLIHDDSHTVEQQKLLFAKFMDLTQETIEYGYDRRKFGLPLQGKSLKFESSQNHLQLQVADIITSSFTHWATCLLNGETEDYLFSELEKLNLDKFIGHNKIWPSPDVHPADLGTVHDGGINPADHMPDFLARAVPNPEVAAS